MERRVTDGIPTYHFEGLANEPVVHAVFTRVGGVSTGPFATLNVGGTVGDEPAAVAQNHARVCARMNVGPGQVTTAWQVHGNRVAVVGAEDAGATYAGTDGLVTAVPRVALMLRFADCVPILLYDPVRHVLGLIHAGWRGLAQGIARRAVEVMHRAYGSDPATLFAGLGPAIGPCCYLVGDNVATALGYALPDWRQVMKQEAKGWRLDLPTSNAQQLAASGVCHTEQADLCTCCRADEFYSHRASQGCTGRFAVVAYLGQRQDLARSSIAVVRSDSSSDRPFRRAIRSPSTLHPPGLPAFTGDEESNTDPGPGLADPDESQELGP